MEAIIQDNIIMCDNSDIDKLIFDVCKENESILDVFIEQDGQRNHLGHICVCEDDEMRDTYEDEGEDYSDFDINFILINYDVTWLNSIKFIQDGDSSRENNS